jgi:putative ABC transport system permease protein
MILTLATRNLFHDRIRLIVTLVGILFSVVLVAAQLGLYIGASRMINGMIDNAKADLWVMTYGAKSFEEGGIQLTPRERHAALATPGVATAVPLLVSFAEWRKPGGGSTTAAVIGTNPDDGGLGPWGVTEGSPADITAPDAVIVDKSYLADLGIKGIGDTAQIDTRRVRIKALTEGVRSFTMAPFVFTPLNRARTLIGAPADAYSYLLVRLVPGADVEAVRRDLGLRLTGVEVLTAAEFRNRNLDVWLFSTGAGVALIGGAVLGLIVGTVIVAQTLYSSTKDHLNEFATLRALGSSSAYIHKVILAQAGVSGTIGYLLGMTIAMVIVVLSEHTPLPIIMTPGLAIALFMLTLFMCAVSAVSAIVKVTKIDPAMVFSR